MKFGYTRVSTAMQAREGTSLESQKASLIDAGVQEAHIFSDEGVSGAKASRPGLDKVLSLLREGDEIVVPSLARLGRDQADLLNLVSRLRSLGVEVVFLDEGFDTRTVAGRLMLGVLGAIAEMERQLIAERTALGRERARALGRLGGRPKKYDARTLERIRRMEQNRDLTVKERAAALGIPVASYYVQRKRLWEEETAA